MINISRIPHASRLVPPTPQDLQRVSYLYFHLAKFMKPKVDLFLFFHLFFIFPLFLLSRNLF